MTRRTTLMLITLFISFVFWGMCQRDLWEPDEGRYADIAQNFSSENWWIPYLNGTPHIDKPPLVMWLTALCIFLLGADEWVLRLVPWLSGVLMLAVTAQLDRKAGRLNLSLISICILGSSLIWIAFSSILNLDMAIAGMITLSMYIFWTGYSEPAASRYRIYFWFALTAGFFIKGLIAFFLPVGIICLFALFERNRKPLLWLISPAGILLSSAVIIPWLILMENRIPGFNEYFLLHEHFQRFLTSVHNRNKPVYYYLTALLIGLPPWTFACFRPAFWKNTRHLFRCDPFFRFLTAWFVFVLVFFTASNSKMFGYILPATPALSLILAYEWKRKDRPEFLKIAMGGVIILVILLGIISQHITITKPYLELSHDVFSIGVSCLLLCQLILFLKAFRSTMIRRDVRLIVLSAVLLGQAWMSVGFGLRQLNHYKSSKDISRLIASLHFSNYEIIGFQCYPRTLPYYLDEPIHLVGTQGEHMLLNGNTMNSHQYVIDQGTAEGLLRSELSLVVVEEKKWKNYLDTLNIDNTHITDFGNFGKWHVIGNYVQTDSVVFIDGNPYALINDKSP